VIWFPGESTRQSSFIEPTQNIPVGLCNYQNKNVIKITAYRVVVFHLLIFFFLKGSTKCSCLQVLHITKLTSI
jgi:hypothetical protein